MFIIGIDVGGTFTDFVVVKDDEAPRFFKTPSTPADPSEGRHVSAVLHDLTARLQEDRATRAAARAEAGRAVVVSATVTPAVSAVGEDRSREHQVQPCDELQGAAAAATARPARLYARGAASSARTPADRDCLQAIV